MRHTLYDQGRHPDERAARYFDARPDDPAARASALITAAYAAQDDGRLADAERMLNEAERLLDDPQYADVDEDGQLTLGLAGEQRAIPGLARPRAEGWS
jgi:hypothetical protein